MKKMNAFLKFALLSLFLICAVCSLLSCKDPTVYNFIVDGEIYHTCADDFVLPEPPDKDGYTFEGWTIVDEKGNEFSDLSALAKGRTYTFTAKFTLVNYEAQFVVDGVTLETHTFHAENMSVAPSAPPAKSGYSVEWEPYELTLENITVNAVYTAIEYPITYMGLEGAENPNLVTYNITTERELLPLNREGYDFVGWYYNGLPMTEILPGNVGEITLVAKWAKTSYKITYIDAAASEHTNPTVYDAHEGSIRLLPAERAWYKFGGWFKDEALTQPISTLDSLITEDVTLYAKWSVETYTVRFVADNAVVDTHIFDVNDKQWQAPLVPQKAGYNGVWETVEAKPEDITVNAIYTLIEYAIKYAGVENAENPNTVRSYTVESEYITLQAPTKYAYDFVGWMLNGVLVQGIPTGTMGEVTLTATWSPTKYAIKYEGLLGGVISPMVDSYTVEDSISLETPTREHYIFDGWTQNGKTVTAIEKGSVGDITLTATWSPVVYEITYENIIDTDINENPATYTVESGYTTLKTPVRRGYEFLGWKLNGQPSTAISEDRTGNFTLTAEWNILVYTITYEGLPEGVNAPTVGTYTVEDNVSLETPAREHYIFDGWTKDGKTVTAIEKGSVGDITLTATWSPVAYELTYENLLTAQANPNPTSFTVEDGEIVLTAAVRHAYDFMGWYIGEEKVERIDTKLGGAHMLTARWTPTQYEIVYECDLAIGDTSAFPRSYTVESETIVLPVISANGANFLGWNSGFDVVTEIPQGSFGNITLNATWEYVEYNVEYLGIQNGDINDNPATYTVQFGDYVFNNPVRVGHDFVGWELDGALLTVFDATVCKDITLTAIWKYTEYSITYENTQKADISNLPKTYTMFAATVLPALIPEIGFTFEGWLDKNGEWITEIPEGSLGDIVVTASLEPTSYLITLHPMGGTVTNKNANVKYKEGYVLPVPVKEGYAFRGWYTNTGDSGKQLTDELGASLEGYAFATDRVFYAQYSLLDCEITFVANGGSAVKAATYKYGELFRPADHLSVNGEGMYFAGWSADNGATYYSDSTQITGHVTLTAYWIDSIPISNMEEFLAIKNNLAGTYHLTNDISFSGETLTNLGTFTGILDGNGYAVKNFTMSNTTATTFAIFTTNSGIIKNITFESFTYTVSVNFAVTDTKYALFVAMNEGLIDNCHIREAMFKIASNNSYGARDGSFNIAHQFGAFAANNKGLIFNCSNEGNIEFSSELKNTGYYDASPANLATEVNVGGVVGVNNGTIKGCSNKNTVTASAYAVSSEYCTAKLNLIVGGMVGTNAKNLNNCYATCEMTVTTKEGYQGTAKATYGGFAGVNNGMVESSFSTGSFSGGAANYNAIGGFIGRNGSDSSSESLIRACHSGVDIQLTHSSGRDVGGFAGVNYAKIMNCYSVGDVYSHAGDDVAGFLGYNYNGATVTQCFAGGNVTKYSGSGGFFIGTNESAATLFKCYYLDGAALKINGNYLSHKSECGGNVLAKSYLELWSEELLLDTLEWGEDKWVILFDETPVLQWALEVGHSYDVTVVEPTCVDIGYSIYRCTHCARLFVRDYVEARGHNYDENRTVVVAPTCTEKGYTSKICMDCPENEREHRVDEVATLPHTKGELLSHTDPTCTEEGVDAYACTECGTGIVEKIAATGHTEYYTKYYVRPQCSKNEETGEYTERDGQTEEISCSVCHEILSESVVIPAHQYVLIATETAPTCDTDGFGTYKCEHTNCGKETQDIILKLGHTDLNEDRCCDLCLTFLDRESVYFYEISTVEDFLNITRNPTVEYKLMNDLDFTGVSFAPIGTALNPFMGYFDGNGFKIKNVSFDNAALGGVFGYNSGVIRNLTVENIVTTYTNAAGQFGGIVARNNGYVSGCKVTGSFHVLIAMQATVNEFADVRFDQDVEIGGIVGFNGVTGKISDCSISSKIQFIAQNELDIETTRNHLSLIGRNYKYTYVSNLSVDFGMVAYANSGYINNTQISLASDIAYTVSVKNNDTTMKIGKAYVFTDVQFYSIAAGDYGNVQNTSGGISGACGGWVVDVSYVPVRSFSKKYRFFEAEYGIDVSVDDEDIEPAESFSKIY